MEIFDRTEKYWQQVDDTNPRTIRLTLRCQTAEARTAAEEAIRVGTNPDRVVNKTLRTGPTGAEACRELRYRWGDQFEGTTLEEGDEAGSLVVVLHVRPNPWRICRDMVVCLMQELWAVPGVLEGVDRVKEGVE